MNSNVIPNRHFIILSPPRCKSSWLRSLLHSHPVVSCHSEIFHHEKTMLFLPDLPRTDLLLDLHWRNQHPDSYLQRLMQQTRNYHPNIVLTGFKLLACDYQIDLGLEAALATKPLVLLLKRNNKLAWYSSLKISLETDVWGTFKKILQQHQIIFKASEFQSMVRDQMQIEKTCISRMQELNVPYMEIEYEELEKPVLMHKVLKFLGLPRYKMWVRTQQQNSRNIISRFKNPDYVQAFATEINHREWLNG